MTALTFGHNWSPSQLIPLMTGLAAVMLDVLPLAQIGPSPAAPALTLSVAFFWAVYRPRLFGAGVTFALAILLDAWSGLPLGLTAAAFLITRAILLPKEGFLASSPFVVVWGCFALASLLAIGLQWAFACSFYARVLPVNSSALDWLLTVLCYPLIAHLLALALARMPKVRHESGS